MKTDFYTKFILSVIAVCLTINVLKDFQIIESAHANKPVPVVMEVMDVNIRSVGGQTVTGTIPVEAGKTPLKVEVDSWKAGNLDVVVDSWKVYPPIKVTVDSWSAGTLDVRSN